MKTHKTKSYDEVSDVSGLKAQLGSVLKEIVAFSERLEESNARKVRESDFGHARWFDYDSRVQDLKGKLHPGKDPAKPVIFLARMVIECLNKGPMSEKDIKNAVLERCKETGIKSSNRGLIAGTGMDVATVCNVLGVLGALEQTTIEGSAAVKAEPNATHPTSTAATSSNGAAVVYTDAACITGPGAELYKALTERWHPRLTEYFEDALKNKQANMNSDNASVTKTEMSSSESTVPSVVPAVTAPILPAVPVMSHTQRLIAEYRSGNTENLNARAHLNAHKPSSQKSLDNYFAPAPRPDSSHASHTSSTSNVASSSGAGGSSQYAQLHQGIPTSTPGNILQGHHVVAQVPHRGPTLAASETSAVAALTAMDHSPPAGVAPSSNASTGTSHPSNGTAVNGGMHALSGSTYNAMPAPPSTITNSANSTNSANNSIISQGAPSGAFGAGSTAGGPGFAGTSIATHGAVSSVPSFSTAGVQGIGVSTGSFMPHNTPGGAIHGMNMQSSGPTSLSGPLSGVPSLSLLPNSMSTSIGSGLNSIPSLPPLHAPLMNIQPFVSPLSVSMGDIAAQAPAPAPAGKAKTKAAKPASEKKPTKKSLKEAATAQAASAAATASANANKVRRGPSAMRVWRLKEEFVACYNSISHSANSSAHAASSSYGLGSTISSAIVSTSDQSNATTTANTTVANMAASSSSLTKTDSKVAPAKLLISPAQLLQAAALAQYEHAAALELEEKLLRRLAGQCNITLKANRYRVGTTYLSADPDIMSQPVGSRFRQSSLSSLYNSNANKSTNNLKSNNVSDSGDDYFKYPEDEELEPNYALFDDNVNITGAYLLEKVRRTKRQRGDVLYGNITLPVSHTLSASASAARAAAAASVGVFSAAHVHSLSAVCNKTAEFFWNTAPSSPRTGSKVKKAPPVKPANEPITMAQYARNLHIGATGPVPIVLSSCSNGSSITAHTLRRYAQPLDLVGGHLPMLDLSKSATTFAAATGGAHSSASASNALIASNNGSEVLRIPDLALRTREIAWTEIAQEFQVLPPPTEDLAVNPHSASSIALDTLAEPPKEKKRKYLQNHDHATSHVSSGKLAAEGLISVEVLAPQFKEIVPITTIAEKLQAAGDVASVEDTSSDTEDLSDEAVATRHEAVLKAMRDKWNLLQQLKNEALYGPGGVPPEGARGGNYRGGGGYGYFGGTGGRPAGRAASISVENLPGVALQSALTLPVEAGAGVGQFQNLSPRKRGLASAHAKRRGRPPKVAKVHHHHHNNSHSHAQNAHSSSNALDDSAAHRNSVDLKTASESFEMHEESEGEE